LSEGQIQFTVDPPVGANLTPPHVGAHSTETVFQAAPQPPGAPEASGLTQSVKAQTPEAYMNTTPLSSYGHSYVEDPSSGSRKKPRVKSEKRSQSMTIWWAERKARAKELEEKSGTPPQAPISRSTSSTGRRGGKAPTNTWKPPPEPQHLPPTSHAEPTPQPAPQVPYPVQYQSQPAPAPPPPPPPPPPFSAPSPNSAFAPTVYSQPPQVVIAPLPPTALSAGPPPLSTHAPSFASSLGPSLAPNPTPNSIPIPIPTSTSNSSQGPTSGRALAPAPLPPQMPRSYPSPYGPRTAPRPKNNVPPPLAPAPPPHVSPYPLMAQGQSAQHKELPFKVMIPGPPPGEQRRGSR
jgi:hypothetical protein